MLDEIDKVGADFRGDPSSALLEVLDPEQNNSFRDNYLGVTFDLSNVIFMTTANILDTIQPPLRDRMEIIRLAGYTEEEKREIARRHLLPKQMEENGISARDVHISNTALDRHNSAVHAGGRTAPVGARDWNDLPQGCPPHGRRTQGRGASFNQEPARVFGRAKDHSRRSLEERSGGSRHGSGVDRGRRRCAFHRSACE